jgi:hypothetical protein
MLRTFAGVLVGLMVLTVAASAGIPDPDESWVDVGPDPGMVSCPLGDGPVYEYITVHAHRADTTPIEGILATSFFFTVTGGNVTITAVDPQTDATGTIRFNMVADETIEQLMPNELVVECQIYTVVLNDSDGVQVATFDLSLDDCVGFSDFGMFTAMYLTPNPRADYNFNGMVDLPDFGMFVVHYLHNCP